MIKSLTVLSWVIQIEKTLSENFNNHILMIFSYIIIDNPSLVMFSSQRPHSVRLAFTFNCWVRQLHSE